MRHEYSLDALNFFLADFRQELGPYLAIYLLTERHWAEDRIGFVMTIATVCGHIVQTPAGALTDASHAKRAIVVAAAVVPFTSSFVFVARSQAAADAAAAFFGPAIAAITLGIMGPRAFTRRIGRNESFNHAGNAFAAALAGVCAWIWGPIVVLYLIASMALLSIVSVLTIRAEAIDHDLARGLHDGLSESQEKPSGLSVLMDSRGLLIFCLCCVIFHLANAAMLPLVGQKLALQNENEGTALMSGCIVAARVVMVPMAILVDRKADIWGRKPLFLAGLANLSLRGFLYPLSDNRFWLFAVQSREEVMLYEDREGWGWVQLARDGYVGYISMAALVEGQIKPPHRIGAWFSMELGLDLPSLAKDGAARPQREGEQLVPRVLPRRRVVNPLRLVAGELWRSFETR